ncbi:MAG: ATP-dependent RecD-like DNA helicase [Tindallia sp. MSAO_Bac2]|nr:MAG: ATP-dependent RecD-like DNA helicase [Tindallia sp. MSAO_Bac2]
MEIIRGLVERVTYLNEENGYTVIKVKAKGFQDLVTLVGIMGNINVGSVLEVKGNWKVDPQYGKQFQVIEFQEKIPASRRGIEKYLGSGLIHGVGPVNAKRIVGHFGETTIQVLDEEPERLMEVEGIGKKRAVTIQKAWEAQKDIKNVMLFLQSHGVSTAYAVKIYKTYGNESIPIVSENPYRLAEDIWGIGFKTADKIAKHMGFENDSPNRVNAGLEYVLAELSGEGHCYARKQQLTEAAVSILEIDEELVEKGILRMLEAGKIINDLEDSIYLPVFYYSEVKVARKIANLMEGPSRYGQIDVEKQLKEQKHSIKYHDIQIKAIHKAIGSKMMVLTGGPGTGKTTTTLAIIKTFEQLKAKVMLCAPTGRAAKRLSETTRREAKTIHRMLEFKPGEGFKKNQDHPLNCDVLIVDEASMLDIVLTNNLIRALKNDTVLIFVGDVDQLPSVGPGNVLKDIIASGCIPVVKLERIFRQARGSLIITNAHRINQGDFPYLKGRRNRDFFYMESDDPEEIPEKIVSLCNKRLPQYYGIDPIDDIQILCPMQRGSTGAFQLNQLLQERLNPQDKKINYGGTQFRLQDKVMQIRNNYDKNVYNGDIGRVTGVDEVNRKIFVNFDGLVKEYQDSEMDEIVLAYAMTVHKSQGSEYPVVIAPLTTQHFMMLQRNLLYTCVTRAKKILVLIGSKKAIAMAVKNNKVEDRNTWLARRIEGFINQ